MSAVSTPVAAPRPAPASATGARQLLQGALARFPDYLELTKPRITLLVLVTTWIGFALASPRTVDVIQLLHTLFGTALVASGASALNQFLERDTDGRMNRTRTRPLPAGRLDPGAVLVFAVDAATLGAAWLAVAVSRVSALLALLTLATYVLAYTPLKRRTPWSTVVGAVPGALPPVIGWVAAGRGLEAGAVALFAILFLWQLPHFFAIGWLYRQDYARAELPMLPVVDPNGRRTAREMVLTAALLVPASLLPALIGMSGAVYAAGATLLSVGFLNRAIAFARNRADADARSLFRASLIVLPAILGLMLLDRAG